MTTPREDLAHAREQFFRAARSLAIGYKDLRGRVKAAYVEIALLTARGVAALPEGVAVILRGHNVEIALQQAPQVDNWIDSLSNDRVDKLADDLIRMAFQVERAYARQEVADAEERP